MKNLPRLLLLAATLGLAASLTAQTDDSRGPRRGPGGGRGAGLGHGILRVLDIDRDREISATELANAPSAIRTLDVNGDGTVAADELHPARPAGAPTPPAGRPKRDGDTERQRPIDPVMLALDANSDGALSTSEIANATTSLTALDANKDGKLTVDEFRPLPPTN